MRLRRVLQVERLVALNRGDVGGAEIAPRVVIPEAPVEARHERAFSRD